MTLRRIAIVLACVVAVLAVGIAGALLWGRAALALPWSGWSGPAVVVELPDQTGARQAISILASAGVLRHPALVERWLIWQRQDRDIRAGEYRFDRPASALEVIDRICRGDVLLHPVTIPEGLDLMEVARRIAAAGLGSADALTAAFRNPLPVSDIDPAAADLEGYLFPDTYRFPKGTPAKKIARVLVRRFRKATGPDLGARAEAAGLRLREVVTLASLVEEETSRPEERPRVARVFLNRLRLGMPLQCDPTVLYALRRMGHPIAQLTRAQLRTPSPWNTYRRKGLPPGPICNPGRASLDAVLAPSSGADLYFVAAPGGGHTFSKDLASHNRAVGLWRRYERSSR